MAEFQTVVKEALRFCKSHSCMDCPFEGKECTLSFSTVNEAARYEQLIMNWAKKNPLTYPSWNAWISSLGVKDLAEPISEELASQFGIKPLERFNPEE